MCSSPSSSRFTPGGLPDEALIERLAQRFGPVRSVAPIAPDASVRRFFRLDRVRGKSRVALVDPLGGPAALDRMVAARGVLAAIGVRTPTIDDRDDDLHALLLEDFGDLLLAEAMPKLAPLEQIKLYAEAGCFAGLIASAGAERVGRDHILAVPELGRERLRAELALFAVHDVAGRRGCDEPRLLDELAGLLDQIANRASAAPLWLAHRDFHARNALVLPGPRLGVVDFQDALFAPQYYDLASLIRDPYVEPGPELARVAIRAFVEAQGRTDDPLGDPLFAWVALQRDLKAIGTYAFQAATRQRPRFLTYIPAAERLALLAVDALPEQSRAGARSLLTRLGFAA